MPLHELYRLTRERLSQENNSTRVADQSSSPENDVFELVWEKGQILSQGQSSRVRKSPTCRSVPSLCLPSNSPRGRDKDVGFGSNTRMEKFGDLDSGLNEIPMSASSREVDLSLGEDLLPWMDYTIDGSLQHEYSSDFLHEISGVTENNLPSSNNFTLLDRRSNGNQVFRDSHKNSTAERNISKGYSTEPFETARPKASTSQLCPPSSHQCETSFVPVRSRALDTTENNYTRNKNQDVPYGEVSQIISSTSDFSSLKVQKQDTIMPSNGSTVMNFSHFARPAATMRANLQNIGLRSSFSSPRLDSMEIKGKGVAATSSNPHESTLVDSSGECSREPTMHCQQVVEQSKVDLKSLQAKPLEQNVVLSTQSEPASKESPIKIDQTSNEVHGESCAKGQTIAEKGVEPAVASSSVCSGNGADRASDDPNQNLKRKSRETTEDSECHSDDVEEESVGVKKAAAGRGGTGSKRTRAAEVHNLSERRRRDRINEKMRALQELIPNCNKVDKASMLDEAIEYLKTLQLQVQIMSMGAGLYMSPMMLPAGMQHMHAPHMAPYAPMGVGMHHMGLGMGYGMGMPDMNGGSSRFPMIQVPQMQGTHIPVPHMSGPTALQGMMARSNPPSFRLPGQGLSLPMPRAPAFPFSGSPIMNSLAPGFHAFGPAGVVETMDKASGSSSKDPLTNVDPQIKQNTGGCDSTSQMPSQPEAASVGVDHSTLVHNIDHASEANDNGVVNPGKEDNLVIET